VRTRLLTIGLLGFAAGYAALRFVPASAPLPTSSFSETAPLVVAHRGGMGLWPEHTLYAFRAALDLGTDVLELDVRRSADEQLVVFHDADLARTTNGEGPLKARTVAELSRLDAGHHFSLDGGNSFPYRGRGLTIPTLAEILRELPKARLSIELKEETQVAAESLCAMVKRRGAGERVLVSSFHQAPVDTFRARCPRVATAATPGEAWRFYLASGLGLTNLVQPKAAVFFVFERLGPFQLVTRRLVSQAAALNLPIYVWGAESDDAVRTLLDAGVAGITTDRPDRLLALLRHKGRPM